MTIQRMDNVLIVVDDLEAAKAFFAELGMELEGSQRQTCSLPFLLWGQWWRPLATDWR
jgi:catechol 2,3-dioxygenase-like lactoylglutathione lyase family enzyme